MKRPMGRWGGCFCTRCGREIGPGEEYWHINGAALCGGCLESFAREDYAPFRHTVGEEAAR